MCRGVFPVFADHDTLYFRTSTELPATACMDAAQRSALQLTEESPEPMRKDSRTSLCLFLLLVGSTCAHSQAQSVTQPTHQETQAVKTTVPLAVEVTWAWPEESASISADLPEAPEISLETTEGQILDVEAWPNGDESRKAAKTGQTSEHKQAGPIWKLGKSRKGRIRARIETTPAANLILRRGDQRVTVPVTAILERPQRTPESMALSVSVQRLPWDSLFVDMAGEGEDGILAPGSKAHVTVGLNLIWPESVPMTARLVGSLRPARGGDELWHFEQREVVEANGVKPGSWVWEVPAPTTEGTYVLEIRASWEPNSREGSRLGRLIRRRRPPAATSVARKVTFTVLDPDSPAQASPTPGSLVHETEVDLVDFARGRGRRPVASGRAPLVTGRSSWAIPHEALIEPSRRDRLRGWILGSGSESARLETANDVGLPWRAVGLKVTHPERPHRLTVSVKGGEPASLGVALVDPGAQGEHPRLVLDACASGPPLLENGPPGLFRWVVWPGATELVLVLLNRSREGAVQLGAIQLTELPDAAPEKPAEPSTADRVVGLYLAGLRDMEPFRGHDPLATAKNLAEYLELCGARAVVLPERLSDRAHRRGLERQIVEDAVGADVLDVVAHVLKRRGMKYWLELELDSGPALPDLPGADSKLAAEEGLVRIDHKGRPEPVYHLLNPRVREAFKKRVTAAVSAPSRPAAAGVVIRLSENSALLGTPDTGFDDATFARFVSETYRGETAEKIPGLGTTRPERIPERARYLAGPGRTPWLTWRSRAIASLYSELAHSVRQASKGAELAVATPEMESGLAGEEARRLDRAGLAPGQVWRALGLDLAVWPRSGEAPIVLRGISPSVDPMARDLAANPDLDELVASQAARGLLLASVGDERFERGDLLEPLSEVKPTEDASQPEPVSDDSTRNGTQGPPQGNRGLVLSAVPIGDNAAADLTLAHVAAAIDPQFFFLGMPVVTGHEERVKQHAAILQALPAWAPAPVDATQESTARSYGVVARSLSDGTTSYLQIANDSPFPIRLAGLIEGPITATVDDVGRGIRLSPDPQPGGRQLVLDLLPHDLAAVRIDAGNARLINLTPYPSQAVLTAMQSRFNELSAQLSQLNRGAGPVDLTPANPGFEPVAAASGQGAIDAPAIPLAGWSTSETGAATIGLDREIPHSGQASLRLSVSDAPASVISDPLSARVQSSLTVAVSLRSTEPGQRVRVWIEGQAAGRSFARRTEFVVSTSWTRRAVRAIDIPPAGLDGARIRFELLAPGELFIDDLVVEGEPTSRGGRQSAQRALLAAIQAYRESRYADFARLAESHWIREATAPVSRIARSESRDSEGEGAHPRGLSSPLPRGRTLR